ncbi:chaperonin 10-like protein [Aspergillus cavernicola]|uniref:Chaperonin 10-like protein n=1 Tax=Aspergillus cavernicola TaxID=176166 RepID=A0ABR4I945_9EURO
MEQQKGPHFPYHNRPSNQHGTSHPIPRLPSGDRVETSFTLPEVQADEVLVKVTHSGLCGSDIHMLKLPLVLGHEGIGIIEKTGTACSRLSVGDRVGWGPTCADCEMCMSGNDAHAVRKEQWLLKIPDGIIKQYSGGATIWVPLFDQCKACAGVGIVGIGRLGHLAIRFAANMGCDVVVFSSSDHMRGEALNLGANEFYATKGVTEFADLGLTKPVDRLIITSSAKFNLGLFYPVLARNAMILPLSVDSAELDCAVSADCYKWPRNHRQLHM